MRRGATPPSHRSLNPPLRSPIPPRFCPGLAITYPPLAYISLVAPTPPPSPSGRSGCARVLPGLAAAVGGHLSFETGPLLQDTLLAYGLRSVRLSCGPPGETEDGIVASLHSMPSPRPQRLLTDWRQDARSRNRRDGVLLYESSGKLRFDFYSMIATGSDELVELTHRLAI